MSHLSICVLCGDASDPDKVHPAVWFDLHHHKLDSIRQTLKDNGADPLFAKIVNCKGFHRYTPRNIEVACDLAEEYLRREDRSFWPNFLKHYKKITANDPALRIFVADFDHYRLGYLRGDWFDLDRPITEQDILNSLYKRGKLSLADEAPPGCDFDYGATIIHKCEGFGDYRPTSIGQAIDLAQIYKILPDKGDWPHHLKWRVRGILAQQKVATADE